MDRGLLNDSYTALTTSTFAQCWTLDETGNWNGFREDDTGDGSWDLIQSRSANPVNEITSLVETVGMAWQWPVYSCSGNMTTMPQTLSSSSAYQATYDAWNRPRLLTSETDIIADYRHDGLKRQIVHYVYLGADFMSAQHQYYTDPSLWQRIEVRKESLSEVPNIEYQYIWGARYIDDILLRSRSSGSNLEINAHLYALHDAKWNVTAIIDSAGDIHQRLCYACYGETLFLDSDWIATNNTTHWTYQFGSYYCDLDTGIYYVRNRAYHPAIGTWLQRDPSTPVLTSSLYEYTSSRPTKLIDPDGLFGVDTPSHCLPVPKKIVLTEQQCCDAYKNENVGTSRADGGVTHEDLGGVICCQGVKIACWFGPTLKDKEVLAIFQKCVKEHEYEHFEETQACPTWWWFWQSEISRPYAEYENDAEYHKDECRAYQIEIDCLRKSKMTMCSTAACVKDIDLQFADYSMKRA